MNEVEILSEAKIKKIEDAGGAVAWLSSSKEKIPICKWCGTRLYRYEDGTWVCTSSTPHEF